jgi:hypothetical protein
MYSTSPFFPVSITYRGKTPGLESENSKGPGKFIFAFKFWRLAREILHFSSKWYDHNLATNPTQEDHLRSGGLWSRYPGALGSVATARRESPAIYIA